MAVIDANANSLWYRAAHLYGTQDSDTIITGPFTYLAAGAGGNDMLIGSKGGKKLWGNDGNDTLIGNTGTDQLKGGSGDDILTSGSIFDQDGFNFDSSNEGVDTITDYDAIGNDHDTIFIKRDGFSASRGVSSLPLGYLDDDYIVDLNSNLGSQAGFRYSGGVTGELYFDRNGGSFAGSVLIATLENGPTLSALQQDNIKVF